MATTVAVTLATVDAVDHKIQCIAGEAHEHARRTHGPEAPTFDQAVAREGSAQAQREAASALEELLSACDLNDKNARHWSEEVVLRLYQAARLNQAGDEGAAASAYADVYLTIEALLTALARPVCRSQALEAAKVCVHGQ